MKMISILAASCLLAASAAFAADAPVAAKPAQPAASAPADHHCRDNADTKKLAGAARKSFIKKCLADARAAK